MSELVRLTNYDQPAGHLAAEVDSDPALRILIQQVQQFDRKVEARIQAIAETRGVEAVSSHVSRLLPKHPSRSPGATYFSVAAGMSLVLLQALSDQSDSVQEQALINKTIVENPLATDGIRIVLNAGLNMVMKTVPAPEVFFTSALQPIAAGLRSYSDLLERPTYYSHVSEINLGDVKARIKTTKHGASHFTYCAFDHTARAFLRYIDSVKQELLPAVGFTAFNCDLNPDAIEARLKRDFDMNNQSCFYMQTLRNFVTPLPE
jgi:hypothetical protein